jgi:hypothetical protein
VIRVASPASTPASTPAAPPPAPDPTTRKPASRSLARDFRWSYLPPLLVYVAAGISSLTAIVGTFFVKEYLGLTAEFLAALGFWAGLPWILKMPIGHLVDLIWRWKEWLIVLGAGLIAASLVIMIGLLAQPDAMRAVMPIETWYVLAVILAPVGYVVQDVVADAMTVEAVPARDDDGQPIAPERQRAMHVTMQTLGRVAIIGGSVLVAVVNVFMLRGASALPEPERVALYVRIHEFALAIPVISLLGIVLAAAVRRRSPAAAAEAARRDDAPRPPVNWLLLGGGLAFAVVSIGVALVASRWAEEIVFALSMTIILVMLLRLARELSPAGRGTMIGTAVAVFVFRAMPGPGAGSTWWMIDELGFDQEFLSRLSLVGSVLTLAGLFLFRRLMAERSIYYVIVLLTLAGAVLSLPILGMYHGLHEWTAAHTDGLVDARTIALIDTALESPLGQIAMVPMLAWIANSAPDSLKATYFAVMASFTNMALSASQLLTKHLNAAWVVTREVKDAATGIVTVTADYSQLGTLLLAVLVIGLAVPLVTVAVLKALRLGSS